MSQFDYLSLLFETQECIIYELPFFDQKCEDCPLRLTVEWKDDKGTLYNESIKEMMDFYPSLYGVLSGDDIVRNLSWKCINYINNDLRVQVELPASKEISNAHFIEFLDREEPLRRIGIVVSAKQPEDRLSYEWMVDDYSIAEVAHIDFDKFKEWKPKKNQSEEEYIHDVLLKGTRGNIGEITRIDNFRILVKKSKEGMKYGFIMARNKYLELVINQKEKELLQKENEIKMENTTKIKILDTLMGDLGYEGSKYLHPRFKIDRRRPSIQFSDDLYKQLKSKLVTKFKHKINIKRRGRYYSIAPISLSQAAFIFDASHVVVSYDDNDPPCDYYMGDIGLLYNQSNHALYLKFKRSKRTKLKNGQNIHK